MGEITRRESLKTFAMGAAALVGVTQDQPAGSVVDVAAARLAKGHS